MACQSQICSEDMKLSIDILPAVEMWLERTAAMKIDIRLAHIDSTMEVLRTAMESAIDKLRDFRQSILPVNTAPPEILGVIMEMVTSALPYRPMRDAIRLSHVCKRWRSIAIENASLWTDFRIPYNFRVSDTRFIDECLRRSKCLPLLITDAGGNLELGSNYKAVQEHAHRIAALNIVVRLDSGFLGYPDRLDVLHLPNLRTFEFKKSAGSVVFDLPPLFQSHTKLTSMKITGFSSYPDTHFGSLTTLHLEKQDRACSSLSLTPEIFLDLLEQTPALESLVISDHGPICDFDLPTTRQIRLPRLHTARFIHSNPTLLLPYIIFPTNTQVIVSGALQFLIATQRFFGTLPLWMHNTLHRGLIFHFLDNDLQRATGLVEISLLKVALARGRGYIHAKKQSGSTSAVCEDVKAFPPIEKRHNEATTFVWMLRSLYHHPNLASVTHLEIEDEDKASGLELEVLVEDWKQLFVSLPSLEKLRLNCAFPEAIFEALSEIDSNNIGFGVLCPHLNNLRLWAGPTLTEDLAEELLSFAESRQELAEPIKKIELRFSEDPIEEYIALFESIGSYGVDMVILSRVEIPVMFLDLSGGEFWVTFC